MKKLTYILAVITAAIALAACGGSKPAETTAAAETTESRRAEPDDISNVLAYNKKETAPKWTMPAKESYSIPADAETGEHGGPGAMQTTAFDFGVYPEDKRPAATKAEDATTLVIYYRVKDGKLDQYFDEIKEVNGEALIQLLVQKKILEEGTEFRSFDNDNGSGRLAVSSVNGTNPSLDPELTIQAVANTFIDNFMLDEINIATDDVDYGIYIYQ